jgi:hypothetical protein
MKPTDEEIVLDPDAETSDEEAPVTDVREVAELLPAYQEFVREQKLNEV